MPASLTFVILIVLLIAAFRLAYLAMDRALAPFDQAPRDSREK